MLDAPCPHWECTGDESLARMGCADTANILIQEKISVSIEPIACGRYPLNRSHEKKVEEVT